MTIYEMDDMIQEYCNGRDCGDCIIRNECDECHGDFLSHSEECKEAYDVLLLYWAMEEGNCVTKETEHDNVNHPKHYCRDGGMECIDEMLLIFGKSAVMAYCLLNSWKYRYRAADKNGEEDLKKSDWYIRKYKELKGEVDSE